VQKPFPECLKKDGKRRLLSMLKSIFIVIIQFYQKVISPLKPPTCRFYPTCSHYGIQSIKRFENWLKGFSKVEDSVAHSVEVIQNHPLLPSDIPVHGLVIDPETGKLDLIINGYEKK